MFKNENETSEDDESSESGDEKDPKEKVPKVKVPKEKVPNNEESDGEDPVTENSDLEVPMMEYYKIRHQVIWSEIENFWNSAMLVFNWALHLLSVTLIPELPFPECMSSDQGIEVHYPPLPPD